MSNELVARIERDRLAYELPTITKAYFQMLQHANHRAYATQSMLQDSSQERLADEAAAFAARFSEEHNSHQFHIGESHEEYLSAFIYTIEAAKMMAAGELGVERARILLAMAIEEIGQSPRRYDK